VAAVTVTLANASWSGGIVTVVALRTLSHHVWRRRIVDGVVSAVLVICLPDIVAATWIAKVAVECTPILHYDTRAPTAGAPTAGAPTAGAPTAGAPTAGAPTAGAPTAGAPTAGAPHDGVDRLLVRLTCIIGGVGFIGEATNRAWRLVAVLKTNFDTLPDTVSQASKKSYWANIVSKAWHVRLTTMEFHRSVHVMSPCLAIARWHVVAALVCASRLLRAPMAQRYAMGAWILRYHVLAGGAGKRAWWRKR